MSHHTKLDEKLKGADNFRSWKYRISLVLEENELDSYINEEVPVPEEDEAKALHKNNLVMAKGIISCYWIKYNRNLYITMRLGHIISKDGVKVNPEQVNVIKKFPLPHNLKYL